jgi:hypothetical protein
VTASLATKVDKVTGKELSTNDYSTAEKTKLAAITGTNTGDQDLSALATNTALALKANTSDVTASLATKANASDVTASLATKVDKVTGKELSTNDYSTAEKTKLAAITGTNTGDQDLSGYATTAELATKANTSDVTSILALKANSSDVTTGLAGKVDKVTGKELSTNDYSTAEKTKLAAITGTNTGDQTTITGNAGTASKLATPKNINGIPFDGSNDINVPAAAGTLTGTTLNSTVTGSSLTSIGTLANLTVTNPIVGSITGNSATATSATTAGNITATTNTTLTSLSNLATVGTITSGVWSGTAVAVEKGGTGLTAAGTSGQVLTSTGSGTLTWTTPSTTATKLATARKINNVDFDGSADIIVSADAGTLTGTTIKSTVTGSSLTSVGTLTSATVNGKVIVGASTSASTSAVLEVNSTNQGFLPPRVYAAQRDAIVSPVAGLTIWCINCGQYGELNVYNGVAWVNMFGSSTSSVPSISIGQNYYGGKIAYILQSGDPGYDPNTPHGLVAATADQSTGIQWYNNNVYTRTGATGTEIGTGLSNTNTTITSQGATATSYAAGLARAYAGGGYTDWYLPSSGELNKLYLNRIAIGGFADSYYWSSSESDYGLYAWFQNFFNGNQFYNNKNGTYYVRAIRAF